MVSIPFHIQFFLRFAWWPHHPKVARVILNASAEFFGKKHGGLTIIDMFYNMTKHDLTI